MDRDHVIAALKESRCRVVFTKDDGTVRTGVFSLVEKDLPPRKEGAKKVTPSDELIRAYDIEAKGWRSIRAASITMTYPV